MKETLQIQIMQKGELIFVGDQYAVREKVEEMLEEHYGFFPSLQENEPEEEEEYLIYLHTDAYEDLEEDDLVKIKADGITEDPENCTIAICSLLDITFELV